jgi:ubiquinone/menaquinone biosynthesis C-methylase UbiE
MASDAHPHSHSDLSHLTPQHVWDRQARRAPLADLWWRLAEGRPGMRVADVGCGPGFFTLDLARRVGPAGSVLAVDLRPDLLAFLALRAPPPHVRTLAWDMRAAPLPERGFDLVMLTDVLHHVEDPADVLRALRGAGSRLLVAEFDPDGPGEMGPPRGDRIPRAALERLLREAGWSVLRGEAEPFEHYALVAARTAPKGT